MKYILIPPSLISGSPYGSEPWRKRVGDRILLNEDEACDALSVPDVASLPKEAEVLTHAQALAATQIINH